MSEKAANSLETSTVGELLVAMLPFWLRKAIVRARVAVEPKKRIFR
jgi:hypothetical protein